MTSSHDITHEEIEQAMRRFLDKGGEIQVLPPNPGQELLLKMELQETEELGGDFPQLETIPVALGSPATFSEAP